MSAILLPTSPGPQKASPRMLDFGNTLQPSLGGATLRLDRVGNRHAADFTMPPMTAAQAMAWVQRLKRGKSARVVMPWPQPGFDTGSPGSVTIAADVAGGSSIQLAGVASGYSIAEGQFFSVIHGGRRYLYSFDAAATLGGLGPEIVGDPGFDNPAYWNTTGGWSVSGSKGVGASATGFLWKSLLGSIATGLTYTYSFTVSGRSAGSVACYVGSGPSVFSPAASANGTFTGTFVATSGNEFGLFSSDGFTGNVDNFSIKQGTAGLGSQAVTPMLRTPLSAGDVVELQTPMIEGDLSGDNVPWDIDVARFFGLSFTVTEAA